LAVRGPLNVYQIWNSAKETLRARKGPRSAYQKAINSLMKEGYVRIKGSKAWYGKNRTVKIYEITAEGLLEALKDKNLWGHIDEIAVSNEQLLPEYFGFWQTLKHMKADDIGAKLLAYAVEKLRSGIPTFPEKIDGRKPTLRDWLPRLAIYPWSALLEQILTPEEANRFTTAILEDPKAEKLYTDTLHWIIDSHKSAVESFSKALEKYYELKAWYERAKRFLEITEKIKDPVKRLDALKQDEDLWQSTLQLYPKAKDLLTLLERLKTAKT